MKTERIYSPEVQELRDKILAQIEEARELAFSCAVPRYVRPPLLIARRWTPGTLHEDWEDRLDVFRKTIAPLMRILTDFEMMASIRMVPETEEEREWMKSRIPG